MLTGRRRHSLGAQTSEEEQLTVTMKTKIGGRSPATAQVSPQLGTTWSCSKAGVPVGFFCWGGLLIRNS